MPAVIEKVGDRLRARARRVTPADDTREPPPYTGPTAIR
jgi:hypothetical protein